MPYDDIRFSVWDDPDDDGDDLEELRSLFNTLGDKEKQDNAADKLKDKYGDDYSFECKMCGCERPLNRSGYCGRCWAVWNS